MWNARNVNTPNLRTLLGTLMSPSKCNLIFLSELPSLKKITVCPKFIPMFLNVTLNGSLIHSIGISHHFSSEKQLVVKAQTVDIQVLLDGLKGIIVVQHVLPLDI